MNLKGHLGMQNSKERILRTCCPQEYSYPLVTTTRNVRREWLSDIVASTVFGPWPWWQSPACGPPNDGMKRDQAIEFAPPGPIHPFTPIPSSKLMVRDSLRGCNSHISEAKNACTGYNVGSNVLNDWDVRFAQRWCQPRCSWLWRRSVKARAH
jgi:hypothetical protein